MNTLKIASIFLFGGADFIECEAKSDKLLDILGLSKELKFTVRKDEDILQINICGIDGFVIFPCCSERFSSLIYLEESKLPIIILGEVEKFVMPLTPTDTWRAMKMLR